MRKLWFTSNFWALQWKAMDVLILNCCYSICCCSLLHVCRVFHELWPHLRRLPPKVFPWCSTAAVQSLHEKKGQEWGQGGDDSSETNLKFLKQQRLSAWTGLCPVMRGRVSVSLSGACVQWASLFWMEARIDAGFIFTGQTSLTPSIMKSQCVLLDV